MVMSTAPDHREYQTREMPVDEGDTRESPVVFAMWALGLLGLGTAAFLLSALAAQ
jgi:hypothetical protein